MTGDLALLAALALLDASEGDDRAEASEPGAENREAAHDGRDEQADPAPELPGAAPQLRRRELRFEPPQRPRLLELTPTDDVPEPSSQAPVDWVTTPAQVSTPPRPASGTRWDAPWVWSEVGLRTSAHWGVVKVYADGLARVDVQTPTERSESVRTRLTGRHRLGLDATPSDQLHFGLEFSRRSGRGIDPLPRETRATAQVRLRFGL